MKRVFLFVLDSLGIGAMSDAHLFCDDGANTLKRISKSDRFSIDNLLKLGLGNIDGIDYLKKEQNPLAATFRMAEKSNGKDTTIGHWEMAGIISKKAMPTYPEGFPKEIIDEFSKKCKRGVLCNGVGSGTDIMNAFAEEHLKTGKLIVYTSADSVFQIAAHEDIVSVKELYGYCEIAREILKGEHAVGRVIARPFKTVNGKFVRTENRRDFSLSPPKDTILDILKQNKKDVIAVGKISDIFSGRGVTKKIKTHNNKEGMKAALEIINSEFDGLCFVNLVDFDMLFGHRQDIDGYAEALSEFDRFLPSFLEKLCDDDILMITADHGCDPGDKSTDHTREYTPLLIVGSKIKTGNFGTRQTFSDIGKTILDYFSVNSETEGESLLPIILN